VFCELVKYFNGQYLLPVSPTSMLVQLDVELFLEMLPWHGLSACPTWQLLSEYCQMDWYAIWHRDLKGQVPVPVKSLCQMASQFVFRLLHSTMSICPISSWSHRCTIFIWVEAYFKQQLVWQKIQQC